MRDTTSWQEKLLSGGAAFVAMLLVGVTNRLLLPDAAAMTLVASMGASAVLLYAVHHGPLSQPWSFAGGHLVSAPIGVACTQLVHEPVVAAALAVGLAISAMYFLRCLHPPGGATALTAVVGGDAVTSMGFTYILLPVAANVVLMLLAALLVNNVLAGRRYPHRVKKLPETPADEQVSIEVGLEDLEYALREIDTFIDVDADDLARIYSYARKHAEHSLPAEDLRLEACYSNGAYGAQWSVRCITRLEGDMVHYRVMAGTGRRDTGHCTTETFCNWARYQVERNENSWQRVVSPLAR